MKWKKNVKNTVWKSELENFSLSAVWEWNNYDFFFYLAPLLRTDERAENKRTFFGRDEKQTFFFVGVKLCWNGFDSELFLYAIAKLFFASEAPSTFLTKHKLFPAFPFCHDFLSEIRFSTRSTIFISLDLILRRMNACKLYLLIVLHFFAFHTFEVQLFTKLQ